MKYVLIVGLVLVTLFLIVFFVFVHRGGNDVNLDPVTADPVLATQETEYGFSYTYITGDNGYVVYTPEDGEQGDLVFVQSVIRTSDYKDLMQSDVPREGPIALSVQVYRNPMNLDVREWITKTDASQYALSMDGTIHSVTLGDTPFLTYQYDGLYRADAYVYGANGYVYFFSNMWDNPESAMKKDMETLVSSLVWSVPLILAQVAHGDITVSSPTYNGEVVSPLSVEGEARGSWYFEATFPLVLVDWDGKIIAEGYAEAQSDWMTEDYVPFTGVLTFVKPEYNERGALILQKSNASGLPEHDDAIEIPIRFR